jgi:DNA topoisomerase-1
MNSKSLIIVESPSKIKTLKKFLGDKYQIEASVGHIRDLADKNLGLDLDNGFKPTYVVSPNSKNVVKNLKSVLKNTSDLYIATDPDREGEAIAWHLVDELKPKVPIKRMVFNEITKDAIQDSLSNTREINMDLVYAQECRRFLDRLFGFLVSKKLWLNVKGGLSAGRVQSPAVKILVDREKLRTKFKESEYWSLQGNFSSNKGNIFSRLISISGENIAIGTSFNKETGELDKKKTIALTKNDTTSLVKRIKENDWKVSDIETKPKNQNPYPPFITSTLQQEGIRKLRMNSNQVMRVAQSLYEDGHITYMRTDSINLSNEALNASRKLIKEKYGNEYLPKSPRVYKSKSKNAQEAHEAIRPSGAIFNSPNDIKSQLSDQEYKLYDLIWKRTVASQMNPAKIEQTKLSISDGKHLFTSSGKTIIFPGFLRAYVEGADDPNANLDDMEKILPKVNKGDSVQWEDIEPKQHFTKPISRFTEASLVKEMEALGIGRPSTYASIMKRIQDKGYVNYSKGSLIPTLTGYAVVQFLEKYYSDLVNLQYTSTMEDELDLISLGQKSKEDYLNNFYFTSNKTTGLKDKLEQKCDKDQSKLIHVINLENEEIEVRIGRYGLYAQKGDERVTIDDDTIPSELNGEMIIKLLANKNAAPTSLGVNPKTKSEIVLKKGRFGPYLQSEKKMKSLPPGVSEDNITEEIAINIISMPFEIGIDSESKNPVLKDIGRYGPYIKCGSKNRKVVEPDSILDITLERALELLSQNINEPAVLKELGKFDGKDIVVKNGRYGIYITNSKINVSVPKNKDYNNITLEEASEMLKNKKPKKKFSKRK